MLSQRVVVEGLTYFPNLQILSIQNRKVASTSILHALWHADDQATGRVTFDGRRENIPYLYRLEDLAPRIEQMRTAFRFCIVRNPFSRILSAWAGKILTGPRSYVDRGPWKKLCEDMNWPKDKVCSFSEFLDAIDGIDPVQMDPHFRPQTINTLSAYLRFDLIGHIERFEEFQRAVPFELPATYSKNRTDAWAKHRALLGSREIDVIRRIYRDDFAAYGYGDDPDDLMNTPDHVLPQGNDLVFDLIGTANKDIAAASATRLENYYLSKAGPHELEAILAAQRQPLARRIQHLRSGKFVRSASTAPREVSTLERPREKAASRSGLIPSWRSFSFGPVSGASVAKPVVLHIGTHKTGSTFLQNWLTQNRTALLRQGLLTVEHPLHFHRIAAEVLDKKRPGLAAASFMPLDIETILAGLAQASIAGAAKKLVISSEYYWDCDPDASRRFYESQNMRVEKVVCFLRRQDLLTASEHNQSTKELGSAREFVPAPYLPALDWSLLHERWTTAFPNAEVSCIGYDYHRRNGTLLQVFKQEIGANIERSEELLPSDKHSNLSLDAEMLEVARLANRRGHTNLSKTLGRIQADGFSGAPFGLSSEITRQIEATYLPSNMRLAKKLGRLDIDEMAKPGWQSQGMDFTGQIPKNRLIQLLKHFSGRLAASGKITGNHAEKMDPRFDQLTLAASGSDAGDLAPLFALAAANPEFPFSKPTQTAGTIEDPNEPFPVDLAIDLLALAASVTHPRVGNAGTALTVPNASRDALGRLLSADPNGGLMNRRDAATLHNPGRSQLASIGYVFYQLCLRILHPRFDRQFYLLRNPDVASSGIDPLLHYHLHGRPEGRSPTPRTMRGTSLALQGYLRLRNFGFSRGFYLAQYPDVAASKMDPLLHYHLYGRKEGRSKREGSITQPPASAGRIKMVKVATFDRSRKTILVVCHEGSRTGAPIIGYNLIAGLSKTYNVVALFLETGPVALSCRNLDVTVATSYYRCRDWASGESLVAKLCSDADFEFAVVNSIESRYVLRALRERSIPTVTLVHEFASYIRPVGEFAEAVAISNEAVFPAGLVRENAWHLYPELRTRQFPIIPQGLCELPPKETNGADHAANPETLDRLASLRDGGRIVIAGVGYVNYRKGVDLFIQCASRMVRMNPDLDFRFVWIGDNYQPDIDGAYSAYLADQLEREQLGDRFEFIGEIGDMDTVYAATDILLLTSRLDPLPNVTIEAIAHGIPIVCFNNASGTVEVLVENDFGPDCVAGFLDVEEMARKASALAHSPARRAAMREAYRNIAANKFSMSLYVREIERVALGAVEQLVRH
jgi:glycosyltransferase involved in cell wall biosynthesis